jgi:hypothetical protein
VAAAKVSYVTADVDADLVYTQTTDILTRAQRAAINCDARIDASDCFNDIYKC